MDQIFIFDFDSTFIQTESMEVLAEIVLANHPEKQKILDTITRITEQTMAGRYSFHESLIERLALLKINKTHLDAAINQLKSQITPSFLRHLNFFVEHCDQIYIFSGGFIELLWPILKDFHLKRENVYANSFIFDYEGNVLGFDKTNFMAHDQGKVKQLQTLKLPGDIIVIGDGYPSYEMKAAKLAHSFFAFTENIERKTVIDQADAVLPDLDGLFIACNIRI